jgi:cell division transport system permease protein
MSSDIRGAASQKSSLAGRLTHWRQHHAEEVVNSLKRLRSTPVSTLMTLLVIAIALALPLGLAKVLGDARGLVKGWNGNVQVSLYLQNNLSPAAQAETQKKIEARGDVARVELITPAQALKEFKANSGYGQAVDLLGDNPLPPVLVVYPGNPDPQALQALRQDLATLPGVASAELDMAWVQRLSGMLEVGDRLLIALACALVAAVLLVVGNTIRLGIESRREEIVVIKLLGASDAFVRRPFLYMGFWSGFLGGIIALMAVALFVAWLNQSVGQLAALYQSPFLLHQVRLEEVLGLLAFSSLLGLLGATVAVGRHLRQLEP